MTNLTDEANVIVSYFEEYQEHIKSTLDKFKDKNISLDERWEAYCILVESGAWTKVSIWTESFLSEADLLMSLCNLNVDKYESITYPDLDKRISEYYVEDGYSSELIKIDVWRELVLQSGLTAFINDW